MRKIPLKIERNDITYYLIFGPDEGRTREQASEFVKELAGMSADGVIIEKIDGMYEVYGLVEVIHQIVENTRVKLGIR